MRKEIFKVIIFEVILFVLALAVNIYAVEKEKQRQEERAIREENYIHNQGEEIRVKLADFIMVQRYRETWSENSEYEYNYYMYGDDTSKFIPYSIEELGEEEYEKIKKAVKIFSDEDIEKMGIYGYDITERGGIIFSILEYNYDDETGTFHNKEAILDLCPGSRIFNYEDVVKNISIRLTNKYCLETYNKTYEQIIAEENEAYEELTSKVSDLYYEVSKSGKVDFFDYNSIFSIFHDEYHSRTIGYKLQEYEKLQDYLKEKPEIKEVYEKYTILKAEYEAKPEVQRFYACVQKEQEYKKKLWELNLQNPELINELCKAILTNNIDVFDSGHITSYIVTSKEFEELIDEYLTKGEFSTLY